MRLFTDAWLHAALPAGNVDWQQLGQPSLRQYQLHVEGVNAPYRKELVVSPGEQQAVTFLPLRLPLN